MLGEEMLGLRFWWRAAATALPFGGAVALLWLLLFAQTSVYAPEQMASGEKERHAGLDSSSGVRQNGSLALKARAATSRSITSSKVMVIVYSGGTADTKSISLADLKLGNAVNRRRPTNRRAILDTWATENTWFVTDEEVDSENIIRLSDEVERAGYNGLINKTRETLAVLHNHFLQNNEWFLKVDDDTFVNTGNLDHLLSLFDPETPIWLGRATTPGFCHGGGGYVVSRGLLRLIGPRLESCNFPTDYPWEDRWLQLCIYHLLGRWGAQLAPMCTSHDTFGFDVLLKNRKDQKASAVQLANAYSENPPHLLSQTTFHSVHGPLARYLHTMLGNLKHTRTERIQRDHLHAILHATLPLNETVPQKYLAPPAPERKATLFSSWLCEISTRNATIESISALCQQSQLRHPPPVPQVIAGACARKSSALWVIAQSSSPWIVFDRNSTNHNASLAASLKHTQLNEKTERSAVFLPLYHVVAHGSPVLVQIERLARSLRSVGSSADVVVILHPRQDPLRVLHTRLSTRRGVVIVHTDEGWNGVPKRCGSVQSHCIIAQFLRAFPGLYATAMVATPDTLFQTDPFSTIELRNGLALFFNMPFQKQVRWDSIVSMRLNTSTGIPCEISPDFVAGGRVENQECIAARVGVVCSIYVGKAEALAVFLDTVVSYFEVNLTTSNVRRSIHLALREGWAANLANVTIYYQHSSPAVCLSPLCFHKDQSRLMSRIMNGTSEVLDSTHTRTLRVAQNLVGQTISIIHDYESWLTDEEAERYVRKTPVGG